MVAVELTGVPAELSRGCTVAAIMYLFRVWCFRTTTCFELYIRIEIHSGMALDGLVAVQGRAGVKETFNMTE